MPFLLQEKTIYITDEKNRISKLCGFFALFTIQGELTIAAEFTTCATLTWSAIITVA